MGKNEQINSQVENEHKQIEVKPSEAELARIKAEEEEKAKKARIKAEAKVKAVDFVRIGGVWYMKLIHPNGEFVLERYSTIIEDYGKELGRAIMNTAPHCINTINQPNHIDYQEYIAAPNGQLYYNTYRPLKYSPEPGDFPHIEELTKHIFGDQHELGLDYIQLIYLNPMQRLPILVMVSKETRTGKSTFCKFMAEMLGENCMAIDNEVLASRFNSTWTDKILVYNEESLLDPKLAEKIKNYATAEKLPTEGKGKDMVNRAVYFKLILCSNDENHPTKITKEDTRHWVIKIPIIENNSGRDFLEKCKKEIPAFLHFLKNRKLVTGNTKRDRLWFFHDEIVTDAWRKIVSGSQSNLERGIIEMLAEIMDKKGIDKVLYSLTELLNVVKNCDAFSERERKNVSKLDIKEILNDWGLKPSRRNVRHNVYSIAPNGELLDVSHSNKAITITRELIDQMHVD